MVTVIKCFTSVFYLFHLCNCGPLSPSRQAEQTLIGTLLSGYNKNIRPTDRVDIQITASILQIVSIDEKQQIMTSSLFITQFWVDERLSWDPNITAYNFTVLMLPVKSLWIPDTMILNSADTSGYLTVNDYSLASVLYTGVISMILPALSVKTKCGFSVRKFPFDEQMCSINLTSWSQGANRILYEEDRDAVIDISGYSEHPLWKLFKTDLIVIRGADRVPFEDTYNDIISIQLYLHRGPLYFIVNGIFACLILNAVTLISFFLPFASQIGLCMTSFMTYSVYSLNFSSLFPQQSDYVMMITLFFLLSIFWTLASMLWFIIYNQFMAKAKMPKILYVFGGQLQNMFSCKRENEQTSNQILKCLSCQMLFPMCRKNHRQVESVDNRQTIDIEEPSDNKNNVNKVVPSEGTLDFQENAKNEKIKSNCHFCNRCEKCEVELNKDKTKQKNKQEIEGRCNALNYLMFICLLISILSSNLALWLTMSQ